MTASGTKQPKPIRQACPVLAKADMRALTRGSGYDPKADKRGEPIGLLSPRISHRAGAGVGGGVRGELAVEFGEH